MVTVPFRFPAAMCFKYIFQLDCWSFNDPAHKGYSLWVPVVGIQKVTSGSFARSELVDLVLLLLLIGHRHVSQILATWDYSKLRYKAAVSVLIDKVNKEKKKIGYEYYVLLYQYPPFFLSLWEEVGR